MDKKKVAIQALVNWECNYGNRLQNYALQTVVERLGFDVETINDCRYQQSEIRWKLLLKDILHCVSRFRYRPNVHKKRIYFWSWVRRYRKYTSYQILNDADYERIKDKYDYFITGSDQIWRPIIPATSNSASFLQFASPEKRIAYAPSFGMRFKEFPEEKIKEYTKWLSEDWKALSVREKEGAEIVKALTGKIIPVLLDPTMLLTSDDWAKIAHFRQTPKHYLLVNCLRTDKYMDYARKIAKEHGWEIIDIENNPRYTGCGPSEFIYYISHADHVLTNSFHCNVFAFLFHKNVTYYMSDDVQTKKISSRIETLLELTGLKVDLSNEYVEYPAIDWAVYESNLKTKRNEAISYLSNALDIK
ncbi:MAG: polysaccharide pyruvyl transferase family protein [Paludibacteraceae bacterium]|nr:polysaccharide pyruvyl transferase family protein [Paludibacteraceae bacterium]MBQ6984015.1 polysaccharide pyruvyl transferase family protein [Paludibacteraceae bacterium]